ncbi:MAG: hypothetical protein IPO26_13995 [Saprospiraceae bacterium]|nr:hypothetical protein [Saprospiraceae bacterium]
MERKIGSHYAEITSATDSNGGPRVDADSNPGSNNPTENELNLEMQLITT